MSCIGGVLGSSSLRVMDTTKTLIDSATLASAGVDASAVTSLAVPAGGAARLCGVSRSQWWKLHASGKVPLPVYLGSKAPRWRVEELRAWLAAGCPDRQEWQRRRGAQR
jgi:predicted DNA-binding transcriptional regulator AlpA